MAKSVAEIREVLTRANTAYRLGVAESFLTDEEYDLLKEELEMLAPNDPLLQEVGIEIPDTDVRKQKLDVVMASMEKIRTSADILAWTKKYGISLETEVFESPKLDGLSLAVNELTNNAATRGNGVYGQRSDEHYKLLTGIMPSLPAGAPGKFFTFGEAIMSRENFKKYSDEFANGRNYISGLLGAPDARPALRDAFYMRYGLVSDADTSKTRSEQMDYLNAMQRAAGAPELPYSVRKLSELTEENLKELFMKWNKDFELDGIIIEVNSLKLQKELGRESNQNPAYARAYKGDFEEVKPAEVIGITYKTSKQGLAKPIIQIKPVLLDGAEVSNITGNNARYIQDMGIGIGTKLLAKRSGFVIPKIVKVVEPGTVQLPTHCSCGGEFDWNDNKIELVCQNVECDATQLQRVISFFQTLEVDNVSDGTIQQFFDAGYNTIQKVLNLTKPEMEQLDRFGKRKAEIIYNSIRTNLASVTLSKLQHATGFFKSLGSKKLLLLEHFDQVPTVEEVAAIDGFATTSANAYISAYTKFTDFKDSLPDYIGVKKTEKKVALSAELTGKSFVFTGIRRKDLESIIEEKGGSIGNSVSKTTTYLVTKDVDSTSSKIEKARKLGCQVLTVEQLEALLGV